MSVYKSITMPYGTFPMFKFLYRGCETNERAPSLDRLEVCSIILCGYARNPNADRLCVDPFGPALPSNHLNGTRVEVLQGSSLGLI